MEDQFHIIIVCPTNMYPERVKSQELQKCAFRSLCLQHCISKLQQLLFHKSPSFLCLFPTDLLYHSDLTLWKLKSSSAVYTKVDAIYDISPPDTVRDVTYMQVTIILCIFNLYTYMQVNTESLAPVSESRQILYVGMVPTRPQCICTKKPSKLANDHVISLSKHLAILFQHFSTQQYSQVAKAHLQTYCQQMTEPFFCLRLYFRQTLSKLAEVLAVVRPQIHCNHYRV